MEICSTNCVNLVAQLNTDEVFKTQVANIAANDTDIKGDDVKVGIEIGSTTCVPGCTVITSNITSNRFLYPFETDKAVSSVTSEHSGRQLQISKSTVVNVIVDMAATGQSVDSAQLLRKFENNKDTLNEDGILTVGSIVIATLSPSSVPSSEPSATPSGSSSPEPSASPSESPFAKPSTSPSDTPS